MANSDSDIPGTGEAQQQAADALAARHVTTASPPSPAKPRSGLTGDIDDLPSISLQDEGDSRLAPEAGPPPTLTLGATVGQGSMGVVHRGRQLPLRRDVAIKTLLSDQREGIAALLTEARITGGLEHPNVVPVHVLARAPDGLPLMVMKFVEGSTWEAVLQGSTAPNRLRQRLAAGETAVQWHLEVFEQVLNAVEYAHAQGIVHRDLKPDNVMLGEYGEVYVVDWGLAVSVRDPELPRADAIDVIAGTPGYMAPEQALVQADQIGPATDIFQLGAILHRLVTGEVRHPGPPLSAVIAAANIEPYAYGPDVPEEMAQLLARATAPKPNDRFGDIADFRATLAAYQRHRASNLVLKRALERLDQLETAVALPRTLTGSVPRHSAQGNPETLFAGCRVAFEQALQLWPENPRASHGVQRAIEHLVQYRVTMGDATAAAALLQELEHVDPMLRERVEEALVRREAERQSAERLADLERDADLTSGADVRSLAGLAFAPIPLVMSTFFGWYGRREPTSAPWFLVIGASIFLLLFGYVTLRNRAQLATSAAGRKVEAITVLGTAGTVFAALMGALLNAPIAMSFAMMASAVWVAGFTGYLYAEPRLKRGVWACALVFPFFAMLPQWSYEVFGVFLTVFFIGWWWAWQRPEPRDEADARS